MMLITQANSVTRRAAKFDSCTRFGGLLRDCKCLQRGKWLHGQITQSGLENVTFLCNLLVQMYSNCGSLQDAESVFCKTIKRNIYSYTIMLTAFVQSGRSREALHLFHCVDLEGLVPDEVTFVNCIAACCEFGDLAEGKAIHARLVAVGIDSNLIVANSLLNMYGRIGALEDATVVFQRMKNKDIVSWTSMITVLTQRGHSREALKLYDEDMELEPNDITFIALLGACVNSGDLSQGMKIHSQIVVEFGLFSEIAVANALMNMYVKCGSLTRARRILDSMIESNPVSWTLIIDAYAQRGLVDEGLEMFHRMGMENVLPDEITFVSLLYACSHGGKLSKAKQYFGSMMGDYGLSALDEHRRCMVDLVGRMGWLRDAEAMLKSVSSLESSAVAWKAMLSACRLHNSSSKLAHWSTLRLIELEPEDATAYIMFSSTFSTSY